MKHYRAGFWLHYNSHVFHVHLVVNHEGRTYYIRVEHKLSSDQKLLSVTSHCHGCSSGSQDKEITVSEQLCCVKLSERLKENILGWKEREKDWHLWQVTARLGVFWLCVKLKNMKKQTLGQHDYLTTLRGHPMAWNKIHYIWQLYEDSKYPACLIEQSEQNHDQRLAKRGLPFFFFFSIIEFWLIWDNKKKKGTGQIDGQSNFCSQWKSVSKLRTHTHTNAHEHTHAHTH